MSELFSFAQTYLVSFILFIYSYLFSDTNKKSKHIQKELKGKSNFVLLLNEQNPRPKKRKKEKSP